MSDETPTPADDQPAPEASDTPTATESPEASVAVATIEPAATPVVPDHAQPPAEPVTFTRKFLLPLVIPVGVAATIIFYVLNVSRVFLASGGALAVTYATIITISILAGGSALAASPRLRSSSLTLILGGAFLFLLMAGLVSIGAGIVLWGVITIVFFRWFRREEAESGPAAASHELDRELIRLGMTQP